MPTPANETVIMTSNDGSITLTSHRLIQHDPHTHKEILLKDFVYYQVTRKKSIYYLVLCLVFGFITALLAFQFIAHPGYFDKAGYNNDQLMIVVLAGIATILTGISWQTRGEHMLLVTGHVTHVEFSIEDLKQKDLKKFLDQLVIESDRRKSEQ